MNRGLLLLIGTVVAVPVLLWMVRHDEPKRESKPEVKPEPQKPEQATAPAPVAVSEPATSDQESTVSQPAAAEETSPTESAVPEVTAQSPAADSQVSDSSLFTGIIVHDDGATQELAVNSATENRVILKKADGPFPEWVISGARLQLKLDVPGKKKNQLVVQAQISELGEAELTCDLATMNAGLKKRYMNFLQALKEPKKA